MCRRLGDGGGFVLCCGCDVERGGEGRSGEERVCLWVALLGGGVVDSLGLMLLCGQMEDVVGACEWVAMRRIRNGGRGLDGCEK